MTYLKWHVITGFNDGGIGAQERTRQP